MAIRWLQDGEKPEANVLNRPLRDFSIDTGWNRETNSNVIANATDIRVLLSGSYVIGGTHPQNPSGSRAHLLIEVGNVGARSFLLKADGIYKIYEANSQRQPSGTIIWTEIYHSRNLLAIGTTAASARSAMGLGNAATWNIGTGASTIAAGNDSRIVNAASVTYVNTGLNTKANQSVQILPGDGMSGGGNLAGNRVLHHLGSNRKPAVVINFNTLPDRFPYSGFIPEMSQAGSSNGPPSGTYFYVEQLFYSSAGNLTQIAYPYQVDGDSSWMRSRYSGTWSPWRLIYNSANQLNIGTSATTARAALALGNVSTTNVGVGLEGGNTLTLSSATVPLSSRSLGTLDLNSVTAPGFYHQNANVQSTPARNYPTPNAGSLVVTEAAGVVQEYTTYGADNKKFIRGWYSNVWSAWAEVYTTSNQLNIGTSAASARSALSLGNTATHNYGTSAGTIVQGNDWRVDGALQRTGGTITGALTVNGQVHGGGNANFNDVYIRSDIRDKKNFGNIDNALEKVNTLTGLTYEVLSSDGYEKSVGLIAQDVQKILPNAVGSSKNVNDEDRLTLSYNAIVALLVESVKELTLKVEELEKK